MDLKENNVFTGNKIKSYRTKNKMLQSELAKKIGVKGSTISAYESGVVELPHSRLLALAEVFDINYLDLLPVTGTEKHDTIFEYLQDAKSELSEDQLVFVEDILKKALSLDAKDRADLFKNIKLAVKFFEEG